MRTDELDYDLPQRLIATHPVEPRDSARMLVVGRSDPNRPIEHRHVRDLPEYVNAGDALVFNTSAVARARLAGRRVGTGGKVEGLFLAEAPGSHWIVMLQSGGRLRVGDCIELIDAHDAPTGVTLELRGKREAQWIVAVEPGGVTTSLLERIGRTPLPPYILKARSGSVEVADAMDRLWYETVYADPLQRGSVAAPTAGLHFTPELLRRLDEKGVKRLNIVLHVGPGTFKPVTTDTLDEHLMHAEWYEVPSDTLCELEACRSVPSAVVAVGTTAVRTLESLPDPFPWTNELLTGSTDLMIAPGYTFRRVDGLLTNFHLPRSTLLALVAAMLGLDRLKAIYSEAIQREYRFYSYGDCMLILP